MDHVTTWESCNTELLTQDVREMNPSLATDTLIQSEKSPKRFSKRRASINTKKPVLKVFDILISLTVVGPCVVSFWRGTWVLMDIFNTFFTTWLCIVVGPSFQLVFVIFQNFFTNVYEKKSPNRGVKILKLIISRCFIYTFGVSCIMQWKGGWMLMDEYLATASTTTTKKQREVIVIVTIGCILSLMALRGVFNCLQPPVVLYADRKITMFTISTRFRTKMSERTSLYVLDCLFSVLVIGTLVVFVWRGAWALIDIFLFPENDVWSAWGSLIVGYSAVAVAFMLQPFMRWLCDRITGVARLLVADIFLILSLIGTINVWRGIWNLLNIYLLPDQLELSCWLTHWICLIVLILLGCSNSLLVRGVYIDAEEPAGKCVVFPCYYLRLIFQEQKLKQLHSEQTKTEMVTVKPFENNHIVNIQNANVQYPHTLDVNHKEGEV